jgi:hypothetical protein
MRPALALAAALFPLGGRAAPAEDWFRAYQYAARTQTLRGCSDCTGERDDVCEVPAGVLSLPIGEYAYARWPAQGRLKLLRSKADPDCAVPAFGARGLLGGRSGVEIAAIRLARVAPAHALLERFGEAAATRGWPVAPSRRKPDQMIRAQAQQSAERLAVVCWPSEQGWPAPAAGADGQSDPGPGNSCELWLLPVKPQTGEPDLSGVSFPATTAFSAGDPRRAKAFDPNVPIEDSLLVGGSPPQARAARPAEPLPPSPAPAAVAVARCGEVARKKAATLERFEQWEAQVLGAAHSLDRQEWTLNAAAWSGHCQEMDVLRAALEQQLGCTIARRGPCLLANGQSAEPPAGSR